VKSSIRGIGDELAVNAKSISNALNQIPIDDVKEDIESQQGLVDDVNAGL